MSLVVAAPTEAEIQAISDGVAELGLLSTPPVLVLLYRFGGAIRWSGCPFSVHQMPELQAPVTEPAERERDQLNVLLVAAETGSIRATRSIRLGPVFTRVLRQALQAQQAEPWDVAAYEAAVGALYRQYPDSADMVDAAVMRWSTGRRSRAGSRATRRASPSEQRRSGHP